MAKDSSRRKLDKLFINYQYLKEKIIILDQSDLESLGNIRTFPDLFIATDQKNIWLKGIPLEKANAPIFQSLPAIESYYLDDENRLFPIGKKTPVGKLEEKEWKPLQSFLKIELPTSLLPGETDLKYDIQIIDTEGIKESFALLTDLTTWKTYAETASTTRLKALKYAVSENNEVFIVGNPLPAISGKSFWLRNSILLPNGKDLEFPFLSTLLIQKMDIEKGDLLVFKNKWIKIKLTDFQAATRSSIRKTLGNNG